MVRIRMKRLGRKNRAFWRINACDQRSPRDGGVIENLGFYDPLESDPVKQVSLRVERILYWLGQGAQPSVRVSQLLRRKGIPLPPKKRARAQKKAKKSQE